MDPAAQAVQDAVGFLYNHPMFAMMMPHVAVYRREGNLCTTEGWAVITSGGGLHVHPRRLCSREEWIYVMAHCLLHLGLDHLKAKERAAEWNVACDCIVSRFLNDLKIGRPPKEMELPRPELALPNSEERLYLVLCAKGIGEELRSCSAAGAGQPDMRIEPPPRYVWNPPDWRGWLAQGLRDAVSGALGVAAGRYADLAQAKPLGSLTARAHEWFISSYPLLGALAASFTIIEDPLLCQRMDIHVAAVDDEARELYVNSHAGLDEQASRFVMSHELLHVGLRHQGRCQGRDPFLWNVACDFVINGWLVEMGLGQMPPVGGLFDPQFNGFSAEVVYDRIVTDIRRYRKLATLRGMGLGDMLGPPDGRGIAGQSLDEFYRRCLSQGLVYHDEQGRGLLPAGLIEEIRALGQPPIPWDVALAQWFDEHFGPLEKRRSYARPSRRQSATPDIPRPSWVPVEGAEKGRTFGVILDTSGSMDRKLLAKALGAIASYSMSREVPAARVVFCDAAAYDQGYMPPEAIAERVRVKGRGGTVLQPAIDLLEKAEDFPKAGPLLIITDGQCDRLRVGREHAFLLPVGRHLPFVPKGKVFRIE